MEDHFINIAVINIVYSAILMNLKDKSNFLFYFIEKSIYLDMNERIAKCGLNEKMICKRICTSMRRCYF